MPVTGWTLGGGLGIFPLRATWFDCAVDPSDTDVMADCPDGVGPLLSAGLGLDLSAQYTVWLGPRPRVALSGGPALRVDVGTAGAPWLAGLGEDPTVAWPVGAGPSYTWTLRPQAGLSAGIRVQPAPAGLSRSGIPWGVDGANGRSRVGRSAGGACRDRCRPRAAGPG